MDVSNPTMTSHDTVYVAFVPAHKAACISAFDLLPHLITNRSFFRRPRKMACTF
jgi:hypothetical protein